MDEIKKKEAIEVVKHIINMPKYNVVGHETMPWDKHVEEMWENFITPKGTTDILVIYLKK